MFADAMMKHLHYIFLFMCLALGMSAILQEEQPALRMLTEASADASVTPAPTGCFISMSTDYFSTIAHRPFFNDENNERKINGVLFQENFYNQASAPSKLLKLKIHPSVEQMQRIFSILFLIWFYRLICRSVSCFFDIASLLVDSGTSCVYLRGSSNLPGWSWKLRCLLRGNIRDSR